jgi:hypothetical protein
MLTPSHRVFDKRHNCLTIAVSLYGRSNFIICQEKGVSYHSWYTVHYKHVCEFLKVDKLFKIPHFHHGQWRWIVSLSKDSVPSCLSDWISGYGTTQFQLQILYTSPKWDGIMVIHDTLVRTWKDGHGLFHGIIMALPYRMGGKTWQTVSQERQKPGQDLNMYLQN